MRCKLFCLIILFSAVVFSQELKVAYEATYLGPTVAEYTKNAREKNYSELRIKSYPKTYRMMKNAVESQDIVLRTAGDDFELKLESQITDSNNMYGTVAPSILHLFNHVYSVNDNETLGVSDDRNFAVTFQNNKVSWDITAEKKLILGFTVFKAIPTYEKKYSNRTAHNIREVWFCPSLNKKGGPVLYNDLPGLILEVLHRNSRITAISIEEVVKDVEIEETQKTIISEDKYHENAKQVNEAIKARYKN